MCNLFAFLVEEPISILQLSLKRNEQFLKFIDGVCMTTVLFLPLNSTLSPFTKGTCFTPPPTGFEVNFVI